LEALKEAKLIGRINAKKTRIAVANRASSRLIVGAATASIADERAFSVQNFSLSIPTFQIR
jgi:hypothetical protein